MNIPIFSSFSALHAHTNTATHPIDAATDNARFATTRKLTAYEQENVNALQQKVNQTEEAYYKRSDNRAAEIAKLSAQINKLQAEEKADGQNFQESVNPDIKQLQQFGIKVTLTPPQVDATV